MSVFSPAVRRHVDSHAPALRTEVVDYRTLLEHGLPQIDFYDSRRHLGALTGAALAAGVEPGQTVTASWARDAMVPLHEEG